MNGQRLQQAGHALLYVLGPNGWRDGFCRGMRLNPRHFRRMQKDEDPIPETLVAGIVAALELNIAVAQAALRDIKADRENQL